MAEAGEKRHECGRGGGCGLQKRIRNSVQRSDAAVHRHRQLILELLQLQQLGGQGT